MSLRTLYGGGDSECRFSAAYRVLEEKIEQEDSVCRGLLAELRPDPLSGVSRVYSQALVEQNEIDLIGGWVNVTRPNSFEEEEAMRNLLPGLYDFIDKAARAFVEMEPPLVRITVRY